MKKQKECPLLKEDLSSSCTITEWEILADTIASQIGMLCYLSVDWRTLLTTIIYNASASVRTGKYTVTEEEFDKLKFINKGLGKMSKQIVLPVTDSLVAGQSHLIRCNCLKAIYTLNSLKSQGVEFDDQIITIFETLSEIFLKEAIGLSPEPPVFISRNY